jgi:hypothetical protein
MLVFFTGLVGATAGVNCSLCQAGTYGTGSGEGLRKKFIYHGLHVIHTPLLTTSIVFVRFLFSYLGNYTKAAETSSLCW